MTVADVDLVGLSQRSIGGGQIVHHSHQKGVLTTVFQSESRHELVGFGVVIDGSVQEIVMINAHIKSKCKYIGLTRYEFHVLGFGDHTLVLVAQANVEDTSNGILIS
eukprot:CAMPEP_0168192148 /NCGR_PEP_ID=MMETSP0139_2-20121125/17892_1 /TAXON_ID=44445 /ORGANISM="Pseudo-nitzschia australis, Strain 10249 10 AB" /LENGTH=106 /DNA_ID=CAMNT_0008115365 /DNA_START=343 /DNA_END=663 /DNA_ORIENTATION=-